MSTATLQDLLPAPSACEEESLASILCESARLWRLLAAQFRSLLLESGEPSLPGLRLLDSATRTLKRIESSRLANWRLRHAASAPAAPSLPNPSDGSDPSDRSDLSAFLAPAPPLASPSAPPHPTNPPDRPNPQGSPNPQDPPDRSDPCQVLILS